jgi:glutathione synthase/RimK-type ligase-like ATP-grasp enzyme
MQILVLADKKETAQRLIDAFNEKNEKAFYARTSKICLISKQKKTEIKKLDGDMKDISAALIQSRLSLTDLVEPTLWELDKQKVFCSAKPNAYYYCSNEALMMTTLAQNGCSIPKTIVVGTIDKAKRACNNLKFPVIAKIILGKKTQQSLVASTKKELHKFLGSIKIDISGIILREFVKEDTITCAVIGEKVFAAKRKLNRLEVQPLKRAIVYKPTEKETHSAICACKALGLRIGRVELSKGMPYEVTPFIPWRDFETITSINLESEAATYLSENAFIPEPKKGLLEDILNILKFVITIIENILQRILNTSQNILQKTLRKHKFHKREKENKKENEDEKEDNGGEF